MISSSPSASPDAMAEYLRQQEKKSLLRLFTCGTVDAGKSTLLGRLLYDSRQIFEDQLGSLARDSVNQGKVSGDVDFSLLVDGLNSERKQDISIDVAYRSFETEKRRFIVADAPGYEDYTRNTVSGALTADLALVVVDARQGVLQQTRRHSFITSLLGIHHVVLAVNKLDIVDFDQSVFDRIARDFILFAGRLGFETIQAIPLCALSGDNVASRSGIISWYSGPTLLEHLETVSVTMPPIDRPFRFPVRYVSTSDLDFRGIDGKVAAGSISVGDTVAVAKSGRHSRVSQIVTKDGMLQAAKEGQSVTLVLEDQVDLSRGEMLVAPDNRPAVATQFQAHVIWFDKNPLMPGRTYVLRTECDSVTASVTRIKYTVDIDNIGHNAAKSLGMNDVGVCNLYLQTPIALDAYKDSRTTGNFTLVDRISSATVGAGMIDFTLHRAQNVHLQALDVSKQARAELMNQRPAVIWFTGLSASGKSTIANSLETLLHASGRHTVLLDGDNVRHGLNRDLGFTDADRVENIRRVAEVAKLMTQAGLIVIVSFISPFRSERRLARDLVEDGEFIEVFVDTPFEECVRRDPKGLYKSAMAGKITNFTGVSSPYEPPEKPEIHLRTQGTDPIALAVAVVDFMRNR